MTIILRSVCDGEHATDHLVERTRNLLQALVPPLLETCLKVGFILGSYGELEDVAVEGHAILEEDGRCVESFVELAKKRVHAVANEPGRPQVFGLSVEVNARGSSPRHDGGISWRLVSEEVKLEMKFCVIARKY